MSAVVDLAAARSEDVPLGAELVEALAAGVAGLRVARVGVYRVAGVGPLGLAVGALGRAQLGRGHPATGDGLARRRQRRPDARAGARAGARRPLFLLQQGERAAPAAAE